MKIEKIKPIPQYILARIRRQDETHYGQDGCRRFYAYLTKNDGELVKITVAVKQHRGEWYCKQVAVHGVHSDTCFVKDMNFYYFCGYIVGWYDMGLYKEEKCYEGYGWREQDDAWFDPYAPIVNKEYLFRFPEYRYSAAEFYKGVRLFKYLRLYEKYPQQVETLSKLGLSYLTMRTPILQKAKKDRAFLKWLIRHRDEQLNKYYIPTLLRAYRTGKPLDEIQGMEERERAFRMEYGMKPLVKFFKGKALWRLFRYLDEHHIPERLYLDYFLACRHLGLDMNDTKHLFPHDFMLRHDVRIEQSNVLYREERERAERERRQELQKSEEEIAKLFLGVAERYRVLQDCERTDYAVFIATSPAELVREGVALDHCVGGYNYRNKFAHAETLIFFVRHTDAPDIPFVTLEYSVSRHCILQCYGHHDSRPDDNVLSYVNNVWLPYANQTIKKITT